MVLVVDGAEGCVHGAQDRGRVTGSWPNQAISGESSGQLQRLIVATDFCMQRTVASAARRIRPPFFPSRISLPLARHDHKHCLATPVRFAQAPNSPCVVRSDAQRPTIYALSTPPGKAGVAVVRVSGPGALDAWTHLLKPVRAPVPWKLQRCRIVHPESGDQLDDGLAVFFKGPKSFTTEDVLELHIHSGRAIIASVLGALARLPYCRPAEPGEFTRRAFEGGRLDLTQVEGLKDLVDAETEGQRRMALRAAGVGKYARAI